MANYQVILQSANGHDGAWLDYCREPIEADNDTSANEQALAMVRQLKTQLDCDARARIEDWDSPCRRWNV
jgi:hypothetical protein|tara:strand:+ start:78 stop:287 length:210 start_codon:yes stop_codon:yes gene_type:complete